MACPRQGQNPAQLADVEPNLAHRTREEGHDRGYNSDSPKSVIVT